MAQLGSPPPMGRNTSTERRSTQMKPLTPRVGQTIMLETEEDEELEDPLLT